MTGHTATSRLTAILAAAALAALVGGAGVQRAEAADLPAGVKALIPAAKAEGTATIFGLTLNPNQIAAFSEGLSKFYGIPIELNMISGLHPQKAAEYVQQARRGVKTGLDIFWTSGSIAGILDRGGLLQQFDWIKELGADPALKFGAKGLRSHDGTLTFVAYNTKQVKAKDAPRTYDDLLDPKWKGRIAMPRTPTPFIYMSYRLGEDKARSLMVDLLRKQDAKILAKFPDVRTRVSTGEFALGIGVDAFSLRRKGAPIAQAPIEPMLVTPWGFHLMKDAEHPNVGKLWAYWITTDDGQQTLLRVRALSRFNIKGSELAKMAEGKDVVIVPSEFMDDAVKRLAKKFGRLMRKR